MLFYRYVLHYPKYTLSIIFLIIFKLLSLFWILFVFIVKSFIYKIQSEFKVFLRIYWLVGLFIFNKFIIFEGAFKLLQIEFEFEFELTLILLFIGDVFIVLLLNWSGKYSEEYF